MTTTSLTPGQRVARDAAIYDGYVRGDTVTTLAAAHGVTHGRISQILKAERQRRAAETAERRDDRLAELDQLRAEAWAAWERSKEPAVTETTESESGSRGSQGKDTTKTAYQVGDASYLAQVQKAIEQERALLGLDAPRRTEIDARISRVKTYQTVSPDDWPDPAA